MAGLGKIITSLDNHEARIAALEGHMEAPAEADPQPRVPFAWKLDVDGVDSKGVILQCTHTDESLRRKHVLGTYDGIGVWSDDHPLITSKTIWLRGGDARHDNIRTAVWYTTHADAVAYRDRAQAALEHVRDEIAARWEAEAVKVRGEYIDPCVWHKNEQETDEHAFIERWTNIAGAPLEVIVPPKPGAGYVWATYGWFCTPRPFDVVKAEAYMRTRFEKHVATLSIDEMDAIWKERQGEEAYPVVCSRTDCEIDSGPHMVWISFGRDMVDAQGRSTTSHVEAYRKAHILACYEWAEKRVAP